MTLYNSMQQFLMIQELKNNMKSLFIDYDRAVDNYKVKVSEKTKDISSDNSEDILDKVEDLEEVKNALRDVILALNKIQIVVEKIGYENNSSLSADVSEDSFINQLEKFSEQALILIENFDNEYFKSFTSQLYYITGLAEQHYNNLYGELTEDIETTPSMDAVLEETKEELDSLPEQRTNEIK